MPVVTHIVRAIFAYPVAAKVWDKLPRRLSISAWRKSVRAHTTQPDLP